MIAYIFDKENDFMDAEKNSNLEIPSIFYFTCQKNLEFPSIFFSSFLHAIASSKW